MAQYCLKHVSYPISLWRIDCPNVSALGYPTNKIAAYTVNLMLCTPSACHAGLKVTVQCSLGNLRSKLLTDLTGHRSLSANLTYNIGM